MGRRHRTYPKELIQFPQNSLSHQASSVLLPCPPHRISPFLEKECHSRAELLSLINKSSSNSQPPHHHHHKNVQEPPPWLKHPTITSKMPQLDNRAPAVPLPHLYHLAKPSSRHKHRTVAPVLPSPRTDSPTKKTPGALTTIEQCLIPPLGPKYQHDTSIDPDHWLENSSGSDHLPKIFPDCNHAGIEALTLISRKDPIPANQSKVPLCKTHRSRATTGGRVVSDTQAKNNRPMVRTTTQGTRGLPRPKRRIRATNALLGLFNLDPVLHPLVKAIPCSLWNRIPNFRTSVLNYWIHTQALKASRRGNQPRQAMSFVQNRERRSRPIPVPTSHLNRRNKPAAVCKYNSRLLHAPCSIAPVSVQTEQDSWETMLLRKYLLDTSLSNTDMEPSLSPPELSLSFKTGKETWEISSQETDIQDTPESSTHLENDMATKTAVHVSIQTERDSWETLSLTTAFQQTLSSSLDTETESAPEPAVHVSIQTETDPWDKISLTKELQETEISSSPNTETESVPEPIVDVCIQTEPDPWEATYLETETDEVSSTGQEDITTPLDSSPQNKTLSASSQWTTPPSSSEPWAENILDFNTLITLPPELEQRKATPQETDDLAIFPSSPDLDTKSISELSSRESALLTQENREVIFPILSGISSHQKILIDEVHETTPPLGFYDQERMFSSPSEAATPLPSPYHQAKDLSNPDVQATIQQKLQQWAILSKKTNLSDTSMLSTESEPESPLVLVDPISDGIEQETIKIIEIMPLRIEPEEPNQIVEDHGETLLFLGNDDQENVSPSLYHQVKPPLSPDQKQETEDTAHDFARDLVETKECGEKTPPKTDLKTTILTEHNEKVMCRVDLDLEDPAQLLLEPQFACPSSPDQQAEYISVLSAQVSSQPEPDLSDTMSAGTELQDNILEDQGHSITPPLSLNQEEMTLSSPDHCVTYPPNPDIQSEAAEDLNPQVASPTDKEHSAKLSEGHEQITHPPSSNPSVTLPSTSENDMEAETEITNMSSTPPDNLDDEKTVPPSPNKTISPSSSKHQTQAPTGCDHQPETELNTDNRDKVESGLPHKLRRVQKRQSDLRLNYIKPYTIEQGIVSKKTMKSIINSIPQEKIKNDICNQILLPLSLDGYSPCDYMVCLICASWIPDGCPHEGMKYPCEARLLAIPILLPQSEEEINVKFVLKCPQTTISSLFSNHSHLKKSSEGAKSSHSDPGAPVLPRPKWLHFILGKSLPQGKRYITRSPERSIDKVFEEGSSSKEGEKAKVHQRSFRSLLERFQWRQKETK